MSFLDARACGTKVEVFGIGVVVAISLAAMAVAVASVANERPAHAEEEFAVEPGPPLFGRASDPDGQTHCRIDHRNLSTVELERLDKYGMYQDASEFMREMDDIERMWEEREARRERFLAAQKSTAE